MGTDTKTCRYCQSEVPKKAIVCPQCLKIIGTSSSAKGCLTVFFGFILIVTCSVLITPDTNIISLTKKATVKKAKAPKTRSERIDEQFSRRDGSHRRLEHLIKDKMNDPGSYEHVETFYWDMKDHLVVRTSFRKKSAYGGVIIDWVKAEVSINNGDVIKIIDQGP